MVAADPQVCPQSAKSLLHAAPDLLKKKRNFGYEIPKIWLVFQAAKNEQVGQGDISVRTSLPHIHPLTPTHSPDCFVYFAVDPSRPPRGRNETPVVGCLAVRVKSV